MKLIHVAKGTAILSLSILLFLSGMLLEKNTAVLEILTVNTSVVNHPDYYNSINYRGPITVDQALEYMREARYWHMEWVRWKQEYGKDIPDGAGDLDFHLKWIERYDQIITLLVRGD